MSLKLLMRLMAMAWAVGRERGRGNMMPMGQMVSELARRGTRDATDDVGQVLARFALFEKGDGDVQ